MAGVFGKDPNMKRKGSREELDRITAERARNKEGTAALFRLKKPAAPAPPKDTAAHGLTLRIKSFQATRGIKN
ncbi:hypothetical protein MCEMSEM18_03648 [Comamonadaceae bacterium]